MYLFTRQVLVNPSHVRAGMSQAQEMARYVREKTDLELSLFQVLQGAPLGTLTFAFRTDSYAASLGVTDALIQSDEYMQKVESGAQYFVGNPQDDLAKYLHVSGELVGPPAAASLVTVAVNLSEARNAVAWAIELADFMAKLTNVPTAVLSANFQQYGTIAWLAYGSSLAQLEEAAEKTNSDAGFAERLSKSGGLFLPGSGRSALSRRIG
jgi:hypothetical protein